MSDCPSAPDPGVPDEGPNHRWLLNNVRHAGFVAGYAAAKAEALRFLRERWMAVSRDDLPSMWGDAGARAYARRVLGEVTNKVEGLVVKPRRDPRGKGG